MTHMQTTNMATNKTLVLGYGNPGRKDDGLGPEFIERARNLVPENFSLQSNYQLTVEDAYELQRFDRIVFVDASMNGDAAYAFYEMTELREDGLGSHTLSPNGLLKLCETLYQHQPKAYVLAIRGYEFDTFEEALSTQADTNLQQALVFFKSWVKQHAIETVKEHDDA